ncbi:MAG: transcription elongation factor GreA [Actinomycetes bacterium]
MTTETGQQTTWLTPEADERLRATLEQLRGPKRQEVVSKIESAREEGDLRENGGYHAAKEEQGKLEARIKQLEALLRTAHSGTTPSGDVVEQGCIVTVDYGGGDLERFLFANRENATEEQGKIVVDGETLDVYSPESPLGQAIAGAKPGDSVTFGERNVTVTVTEVRPFPA